MTDVICMRTTLDIDDDVLQALSPKRCGILDRDGLPLPQPGEDAAVDTMGAVNQLRDELDEDLRA